jgi:multiple sugar transport system substrate-binding protein
VTEGIFTRRAFLRVAAGAATVAATGAACGSGSDKPKPSETAAKGGASKGGRTLRIAQWSHFVPAYDAWFDNEYTKRWGEEHDVEVIVDHIPVNELPFRADAEAAAGRGHDLFGFLNPRPALEDEVIDHREIVEEVAGKIGPMTPLVERSIFNPKTNRYFALSDHWTAGPLHYRVDLWDRVEPGLRPATWDDVQRAGGPLKKMGFPLGLGISTDLDSSWTLNTLMHSYGASIQDEQANLTVNRPATVEAVKLASEIYRTGMTQEVFSWDAASNNRLLTSGRGSLILNAISAIRAVEQQDAELASNIALAPAPIGTAGDRPRCTYAVDTYVVWKFSPNVELAKQFLIDLSLTYRDAFVASGFYNLPAFPGSVPDLAGLVANDPRAQPADKYTLLASAPSWSTNVGDPGSLNAAVDEIFSLGLLPRMFASAARGEMTPEEAVTAAEAEMTPIFEKWREKGKI